MHSTIATLQIKQTALARRHTIKEEGINRRKVDTDDRRRISEVLDKCSHPLEIESDVLYKILNGQVAPGVVNVSDALSLGALMVIDFRKSLPAGFHAKLTQ